MKYVTGHVEASDGIQRNDAGGGGGGCLKAFFHRHIQCRRRTPTPSPSPSRSHHHLLSLILAADDLHRVFAHFDTNGDRRISSLELETIFVGLGHPSTEEELRSMMAEEDVDGDGFISPEEFVELNTRGVKAEGALKDLCKAFWIFDLDKNGEISAEEFANVMRSLGDAEATTAQCRRIIRGVDRMGMATLNSRSSRRER